MGRLRAILSGDDLDLQVQNHLRTARRAVEQALEVCASAAKSMRKASLESPNVRFQVKKAYKDLKFIHDALQSTRSVAPRDLDDPDMYPEALKDRVGDIQFHMAQAQRHFHSANASLEQVENAFQEAGYTFAREEIDRIAKVEHDLGVLWGALNVYRGLRGLVLSNEGTSPQTAHRSEPRRKALRPAVSSVTEGNDG